MTATVAAREWMAVFVMLLSLITLAAASFASRSGQAVLPIEKITITVIGAVVQEQKRTLPLGALVVDALQTLELSEDADVEKLPLDMKLQPDQTLVIPTKGKISVFVTGAVKTSGLVLLPESCRLPDLLAHLDLQADADLKQFKRCRRLLREGETVDIRSV
ncbi:MAG: hypothetical protein JSR46_02660 [Verrucomicrobia bacterium]|nr:hypothetical protein [Verrucomicrobiota bacterium]